jgi:hypothetical protein
MTSNINSGDQEILNNLDLVAVGLSKVDYADYVKGDFFKNGKILIDDSKFTYKALTFTSKGVFSLYGLLNPNLYVKGYQAVTQKVGGSVNADGTQLGGTVIVDRSGDVIFMHTQKSYTDYPTAEDVFRAVKGYMKEHPDKSL